MDEYAPHILVVDDSADTADSLAELLNLWGYDGEAQYSSAAALQSARSHRPVLVLLDLDMPRVSGFEFVVLLHELRGCERIQIVAITGYTNDACQKRAKELGIVDYLFKPTDLGQLRALLARLIAPLERPHPRKRCRPRIANRQLVVSAATREWEAEAAKEGQIQSQEAAACWS